MVGNLAELVKKIREIYFAGKIFGVIICACKEALSIVTCGSVSLGGLCIEQTHLSMVLARGALNIENFKE